MPNPKVMKTLNVVMFFAFLTVATCATIMLFDLIPSLVSSGLILTIHMTAGKVFIPLAILHIILNWNWIKSQIFGVKAKPKAKKA